MKNFNDFFIESILDPEQPTLSVQVFDLTLEPKLKDEVRKQILIQISKLSKHIEVLDYTLIGSILTRRYTPDTDIDVNILISSKTSIKSARALAMKLSGEVLVGTQHQINLHVLNNEPDFKNANDSADAVFDITNNSFIRKAIEKPFHVEKYLTKFKELVKKIDVLTDDLEDDLLDYSELKQLLPQDAKLLKTELEKELLQIETSAVGLAELYNKVVQDRAKVFAKPLTAKDIKAYGVKNRLPENVVYKLLERHHYLSFLKQVKDIIGDDMEVSPKEADKLVDLVKSAT